MDDFTSTCGEDELIGIHCTHGINRTGYLICRYLIQQLGWEIQDTLKAFGEARGYSIERDTYVTALHKVRCGEKIDTSKVNLKTISHQNSAKKNSRLALKHGNKRPYTQMTPPDFVMPRPGFTNGGPFPPQRFGFVGPPPRYGPPHRGMPPISPSMGPSFYGSRPLRYGPPPMRPAISSTPPGGYPPPGFLPRMPPGPPRMLRPPRLSAGPGARLPPLKMAPPPPPPPPPLSARPPQKKRQHLRNGIIERAVNVRVRRNGRTIRKAHKEQDFTADTFEENLLTTSSTTQSLRSTKGRFNQNK